MFLAGHVLVADTFNHRILRFRASARPCAPCSQHGVMSAIDLALLHDFVDAEFRRFFDGGDDVPDLSGEVDADFLESFGWPPLKLNS